MNFLSDPPVRHPISKALLDLTKQSVTLTTLSDVWTAWLSNLLIIVNSLVESTVIVNLAAVSGTADAIVLTPDPAIDGYMRGQKFSFLATGTNTGPVTINVSGKGNVNARKNGTSALVAGDIPSGKWVDILHDGTNFQVK